QFGPGGVGGGESGPPVGCQGGVVADGGGEAGLIAGCTGNVFDLVPGGERDGTRTASGPAGHEDGAADAVGDPGDVRQVAHMGEVGADGAVQECPTFGGDTVDQGGGGAGDVGPIHGVAGRESGGCSVGVVELVVVT